MTVHSILVHNAGVGGKMNRVPAGQQDSWQDPGSVT